MHDPYLYDDVDVLKNKLEIKEQKVPQNTLDYIMIACFFIGVLILST